MPRVGRHRAAPLSGPGGRAAAAAGCARRRPLVPALPPRPSSPPHPSSLSPPSPAFILLGGGVPRCLVFGLPAALRSLRTTATGDGHVIVLRRPLFVGHVLRVHRRPDRSPRSEALSAWTSSTRASFPHMPGPQRLDKWRPVQAFSNGFASSCVRWTGGAKLHDACMHAAPCLHVCD